MLSTRSRIPILEILKASMATDEILTDGISSFTRFISALLLLCTNRMQKLLILLCQRVKLNISTNLNLLKMRQ